MSGILQSLLASFPLGAIQNALYVWGSNAYGQLGLNINTTINVSSPTQVGADPDWASAAASGPNDPTCAAIKTDGTLWTWGNNPYGKLGIGLVYNSRSSPVQVGALTNWAQVSAGGRFCAAVKEDGTLWAWGGNTDGSLGTGNRTNYSSPVQVGGLTNWSLISTEFSTCAAIKTDGTLWTWGGNLLGQQGHGDKIRRSSPTQVGALTNWSTVSALAYFCSAVKTDGTLWTWGGGSSGELGTGVASSYRSSPVQVGGLTNWARSDNGNAFCAAIKTDNTLWMWGGNFGGQLGQGNLISKSSPVQVGGAVWEKVSVVNHAMAIRTDGTLWGWGSNPSGQLGINSTTNVSSPVQVGALANWTFVAAGTNATFAGLNE
jgi:alpha-tubulin suppressor-like RCC1 family protein